MSIKETGKQFIDATINTFSNPAGTARLLSGAATLARADKAGVTVQQMKQIFPDLQNQSDEQVVGFISISQGLINGDIHIQSTAFGEEQQQEMKLQEARL
ncbi:hypothetical protein [Neisseria sp. DTU_2021_1001991_1_SI_NGA_ILE_055]|uniref:hypothetical protein n=1 Tax=Neisseria sp. DTU_2021_1001991_1_SI_NGA_ILE_055 TaxID=3077590 RepID=UPI0028E61402|nr:hypothetical protein [Neisseria sp. DTU_2021_1001991_1_SI_NGA_ILE_055]WNS83464.1 hypothetical protein RRV97_10915 [Neisseria sp. DTU_2021_1001991_1_SI_NGA_ILE_055]